VGELGDRLPEETDDGLLLLLVEPEVAAPGEGLEVAGRDARLLVADLALAQHLVEGLADQLDELALVLVAQVLERLDYAEDV
jgi:hypothetical protein